jgi:tetratricopeptide (TPR) repeat protein
MPAAVDERIFYPRPKPVRKRPLILVMGTDQLEFKGIQDAFAALQNVKDSGREFDVVRVSAFPQSNFDFPCTYVERPTQEELGKWYAISDMMLTASHYESFPLPPLEAMAAGTPVITTANEGVHTYAEAGKNCLMVPIRDPDAMASAVSELLDRPDRRGELVEEGRKTASRFEWERIIDDIERQYLSWVEEPRELVLTPAETLQPPLERHRALMGPAFEQISRKLLEEGEKLYAQGDSETAKKLFEEVLTLMPQWVEPRTNLAVLAWEAGEAATAFTLMNEAYQMAPDHPEVLANLSTILAQSGQTNEALQCIRKYLAQRPDDVEMKRLAESLEGVSAVPVAQTTVR